jgi:hypothetical protein
VIDYGTIQKLFSATDSIIKTLRNSTNTAIPPLPPAVYIPSQSSPPLGPGFAKSSRFSISLRNNYSPNDPTVPLQFAYQATNCRLFYKAEDVISVVPLWNRVARVAWENETCVPGSTVSGAGRIGSGTVPFGPHAISNVTLPQSPGVLKSGNATPNADPSATATSPSGVSKLQVSGGLFAILFLPLLYSLFP